AGGGQRVHVQPPVRPRRHPGPGPVQQQHRLAVAGADVVVVGGDAVGLATDADLLAVLGGQRAGHEDASGEKMAKHLLELNASVSTNSDQASGMSSSFIAPA